MIAELTFTKTSYGNLPLIFLTSILNSWNFKLIALSAVALSLGIFALIHSEPLRGAEVVQSCDAKAFEPCPFFVKRVKINEHTAISQLFEYTKSKGSWTVYVDYEPKELCAKVSLNLDPGGFERDRSYKRAFVNGGGTIDDSGVFWHKNGQLEGALNVIGRCSVPRQESELSGNPDPAGSALDRELENLADDSNTKKRKNLDEILERLALQELQAKEADREAAERERAELDEEVRRVLREVEQSDIEMAEIEREYQRTLERLKERDRVRERERIARAQQEKQRKSDAGDGIETFLELLGTGAALYELYDQGSGSPSYDHAPGNNDDAYGGYSGGYSRCSRDGSYGSCATE